MRYFILPAKRLPKHSQFMAPAPGCMRSLHQRATAAAGATATPLPAAAAAPGASAW
jgi:hypothetical protein